MKQLNEVYFKKNTSCYKEFYFPSLAKLSLELRSREKFRSPLAPVILMKHFDKNSAEMIDEQPVAFTWIIHPAYIVDWEL